MRIYIIANDGITLCREAPATVNDGEIVVASNEELHAAPLSGKRLLALWNALPGVEKRRKVGDREVLIDQLWAAIEALPEPEPPSDAKRPSKQDAVIAMLRRSEGATIDEVATATGWQRHTVRGVFSGSLRLAPRSADDEVSQQQPSAECKASLCDLYPQILQGRARARIQFAAGAARGEAFINSQRHVGWVCLPAAYDDAGFSDTTMDRPALQILRGLSASAISPRTSRKPSSAGASRPI